MFEHLKADPRLDMARAGVMGRSYGGYMTLIQVGWHPDLWKAAVDMFGPYDLFTFVDRLSEGVENLLLPGARIPGSATVLRSIARPARG